MDDQERVEESAEDVEGHRAALNTTEEPVDELAEGDDVEAHQLHSRPTSY